MTEDERSRAQRDFEQAAQRFRADMERVAADWHGAIEAAQRRFTAEREKIERTFQAAEARFLKAFGKPPRPDGASPAPRRRPPRPKPPPSPLAAGVRPHRPSGLTGGAAAPIDETDDLRRGA